MDQNLNLCIADLYQLAQRSGLNFREQAFARIQAVLPFDAGVWANGLHQPHRIHMSYVYRMSARLMDLYNSSEIFVQQDFVRSAAVAQPDVPVIVTDIHTREEFERMLTYKLLCRPLGIEQAMGIAHRNAKAGLFDYLAIWRRSKTDGYSEQDRQVLQILWPHLLAADTLWLTGSLAGTSTAHVQQHVGMVDQYGVLQVADAALIEQLSQDWPKWSGPSLPEELRQLTQAVKRSHERGALQKSLSTLYRVQAYSGPIAGSAFKLQVECKLALTKLTAAEAKIATPYAQGYTHKEIAKQTGLAPGTVRNHAQSILKKLGVRNKTELSLLLGVPQS
jgi:DNA-binding CsgD family transcriptional regulator